MANTTTYLTNEGQWKRRVEHEDGTCDTHLVKGPDGSPLMATPTEVRDYYGHPSPSRPHVAWLIVRDVLGRFKESMQDAWRKLGSG